MKYSDLGFWIEQRGEEYVIGLSEKGQDDLGSISFVQFSHDDALAIEEPFLSVEAAKAEVDLTPPLSGKVIEWHEACEDNPALLNDTNNENNWLVKITDVDEQAFQKLNDTI